MRNRKDWTGPSAFPFTAEFKGPCTDPHGQAIEEGMSSRTISSGMQLRDYFAAKVMQGALSAGVVGSPQQQAAWAYEVADAMLRQREKE